MNEKEQALVVRVSDWMFALKSEKHKGTLTMNPKILALGAEAASALTVLEALERTDLIMKIVSRVASLELEVSNA